MDVPIEEVGFEVERAPLTKGALLLGGRYQIERVIGAGGFALTYLALEGRWNFQVCIKEFFPEGCERREDGLYPTAPRYENRFTAGLAAFTDETNALARFNSPGIVRVLGSFSENRTAYIVQEVLEGMTLGDGMAKAGLMKEPAVLQVAQQLGQALLMVHAAGLVHSDLKPENIFLTREGRYVLLDFGLTRGYLSSAGASRGGRGLSAGYAPPEQYDIDAKLTPAADVYAFAATLYSLLTGETPLDAQLRMQGQILPSMKDVNPSLSTRVERAILNAMVLDSTRRTPGVREFLHQLGLDSTPKSAYRPPPLELIRHEKAHQTGVQAMALNSKTNKLYTGGHDGQIKVWSWPELQLLGGVQAYDDPVGALTLSGKGSFLVSSSEHGAIKLWETSFSTPPTQLISEGTICTSLKLYGHLVAATFADGGVCLVGPSLPEPVRWIAHVGSCNSVDFHPSGSFLVTAGSDKLIRFWNFPEPEMISELPGHEKSVQGAHVSADGTNLLSCSMDHSVRFWDLTTNSLIRELRGHQAIVLEACFTAVPEMVVSLAGDHCVRVFHLSSSRVSHFSEVQNERARCLVSDLNAPLVATSGGDGHISVWQLPTTNSPQ